MNKKDLQFILAYAECYGLRDESVETVLNSILLDECITEFVLYYDESMESYIDDFLDTYNVIKRTGFEAECFTLMRSGYTIWMAARDWDLPLRMSELTYPICH